MNPLVKRPSKAPQRAIIPACAGRLPTGCAAIQPTRVRNPMENETIQARSVLTPQRDSTGGWNETTTIATLGAVLMLATVLWSCARGHGAPQG
jgi:hypothetical protein